MNDQEEKPDQEEKLDQEEQSVLFWRSGLAKEIFDWACGIGGLAMLGYVFWVQGIPWIQDNGIPWIRNNIVTPSLEVASEAFDTYAPHGWKIVARKSRPVTRSEILEEYKTKLKQAYNDPLLNSAATAICQLVARRLHRTLPDTSQLDYDLDEKQNLYFEKIARQLDLDKQARGLVAWRIFRDACKAEVGHYEEKQVGQFEFQTEMVWSKVRTRPVKD